MGYEPDDDIETIRVHIDTRTKLEPDPRKPLYKKLYMELVIVLSYLLVLKLKQQSKSLLKPEILI